MVNNSIGRSDFGLKKKTQTKQSARQDDGFLFKTSPSCCLAYIIKAHILLPTYLPSIFKQLSISNLYETFWYCAVRYRTVSIQRQAPAPIAAYDGEQWEWANTVNTSTQL